MNNEEYEDGTEQRESLWEIARKKGVFINGRCIQESELRKLVAKQVDQSIPPGERPRRPATEPYPPLRKLRKARGPDTKPRKRRGPVLPHTIRQAEVARLKRESNHEEFDTLSNSDIGLIHEMLKKNM
ncbi:hypothetical protein [Paraburkholderia terrae]|uniref:hypothetical protein n=1 Tax=Paraburkholderia terrae TaxID=311230 RepID=UPI00205683EE|nr:hypothetical protein [Paraburkholderia terrae]BDC37904.1 hypothetical protein PTKU15_12010 [Paraburkholderia terrae]